MLYISPLKALAVDVERNLRAPLAGIASVARGMGVPVTMPEIAIRTGDTPALERTRFLRDSADILITTPESLFLLLTSNARARLTTVDTVIIDEIHALVPTKRGAHLALSLERLEVLRAGDPGLARRSSERSEGGDPPANRPLRHPAAARRSRPLPRRHRGTRRAEAAPDKNAGGPAATTLQEVEAEIHEEFAAALSEPTGRVEGPTRRPRSSGRSRSSTRRARSN